MALWHTLVATLYFVAVGGINLGVFAITVSGSTYDCPEWVRTLHLLDFASTLTVVGGNLYMRGPYARWACRVVAVGLMCAISTRLGLMGVLGAPTELGPFCEEPMLSLSMANVCVLFALMWLTCFLIPTIMAASNHHLSRSVGQSAMTLWWPFLLYQMAFCIPQTLLMIDYPVLLGSYNGYSAPFGATLLAREAALKVLGMAGCVSLTVQHLYWPAEGNPRHVSVRPRSGRAHAIFFLVLFLLEVAQKVEMGARLFTEQPFRFASEVTLDLLTASFAAAFMMAFLAACFAFAFPASVARFLRTHTARLQLPAALRVTSFVDSWHSPGRFLLLPACATLITTGVPTLGVLLHELSYWGRPTHCTSSMAPMLAADLLVGLLVMAITLWVTMTEQSLRTGERAPARPTRALRVACAMACTHLAYMFVTACLLPTRPLCVTGDDTLVSMLIATRAATAFCYTFMALVPMFPRELLAALGSGQQYAAEVAEQRVVRGIRAHYIASQLPRAALVTAEVVVALLSLRVLRVTHLAVNPAFNLHSGGGDAARVMEYDCAPSVPLLVAACALFRVLSAVAQAAGLLVLQLWRPLVPVQRALVVLPPLVLLAKGPVAFVLAAGSADEPDMCDSALGPARAMAISAGIIDIVISLCTLIASCALWRGRLAGNPAAFTLSSRSQPLRVAHATAVRGSHFRSHFYHGLSHAARCSSALQLDAALGRLEALVAEAGAERDAVPRETAFRELLLLQQSLPQSMWGWEANRRTLQITSLLPSSQAQDGPAGA